jgi:hypothetical protein
MPYETWFCEQCTARGTVEYQDHASAWEVLSLIDDAHRGMSPNCQAGYRELRILRIWVPYSVLKSARDTIKALRVELEGAEPWLDRDDMVLIQRVWDRDRRDEYIEHLRSLEDALGELLKDSKV